MPSFDYGLNLIASWHSFTSARKLPRCRSLEAQREARQALVKLIAVSQCPALSFHRKQTHSHTQTKGQQQHAPRFSDLQISKNFVNGKTKAQRTLRAEIVRQTSCLYLSDQKLNPNLKLNSNPNPNPKLNLGPALCVYLL